MSLVGFGGFIGACVRYVISNILISSNKVLFPWNTFLINILGCFCLGIYLGFGLYNSSHLFLKEFIVVGFLGGFTTFSTFGFEAYELINLGLYKTAIIYVFSSSILGILAIGIGFIIPSLK